MAATDPPPQRTLCTLVKMMTILDDPSFFMFIRNDQFIDSWEYLYNKGETRNFVRYGIILADFGSTCRFVDLLRWTQ